MGINFHTILQAGLENSNSDLSQIVNLLLNLVIVLFLAVLVSYGLSQYLSKLFASRLQQSYHDLLGEKVILTKSSGPDSRGSFRVESGEEGSCSSEEWLYPGMSARITNYKDGVYKIRPLHIDYRDFSSKEEQKKIEKIDKMPGIRQGEANVKT